MKRNRTHRRGLLAGLGGLIGSRRSFAARRPRRRVLSLEPLERRTLLAVATVGATDPNAAELGNDPGTFQISLADTQPIGYYVSFTLDGTAGSDDYLVDGATGSGGGYSVEFALGQTSKTITVTPINDARNDPADTVVLNLTDISGGCCQPQNSIGTPSSATITIADDDDDWTISIGATSAGLVEADTNTGTFTVTRSGDTDNRYAITVDFTMSGIAQRGTDYVLKDAADTMISGNSVAIPANQTSVTVKVDPTNDSSVEIDEDVRMTLLAAHSNGVLDPIYGAGCGVWGAGGPFDIDPMNNSGTITIDDDDHWQVSVAPVAHPLSTDGTADATERLTNVEQDPGWFQVSRHADTDTSYAITVTVDVYGEADGFDYWLQNAYYPSSAETPQPSALSYTGSREEGGQTIYTYAITLPARPPNDPSWNATEVYVKVEPRFDWDWEGLGGQGNERLEMSIVDATWAGKPPTYDAIAADHAQLDINDGARLYIRTDSNNDGTIDASDDDPTVKNNPNHPGRVLLVNTDDDNQNGTEDKWERPVNFDTPSNPDAFLANPPADSTVTVQNENDLAAVDLYVSIDSLAPDDPANPVEVDVYAVAPNDLVMWSKATKGVRIHRGDDADADGRIDLNTRLHTLTDGDTLFTFRMYVEANAEVVGTVDLYADPIGTPEPTGSDHVKMTAVAQGDWTVTRNQNPRAPATSSTADTIAGLADQIGLNPGEWVGWLRESVPNQIVTLEDTTTVTIADLTLVSRLAAGQTFQIPNTVLMAWFGEEGSWGKWFMGWSDNIDGLGQLGFDVVIFDNDAYDPGEDINAVKVVFLNLVDNLSNTASLHGMYIMGHGDDTGTGFGAAEASWWHNTVGPLTWVDYQDVYDKIKDEYRLGALIIHACYGNNSNARSLLLSSKGIWWGWTGVFNPVTSSYYKALAAYWGYTYDEEAGTAGSIHVTETFGGLQETNTFQREYDYTLP